MKYRFLFLSISLFSLFLISSTTALCASQKDFLLHYKGTPYHDSKYQAGAQKIPGNVLCAYYDLGGESVAYHDTDVVNQGSGSLNPDDGSYLNEFRMKEGVDTSYTKFKTDPMIDNNPYNRVIPPPNLLYVGWTLPGEWFNITVDVAEAGKYSADLLYTSNRGGTISIDVNGEPATGPLTILSTANAAEPVAWRQWHHWNLANDLAVLQLPKGKSVLTVHILTEGMINLATFDFRKAGIPVRSKQAIPDLMDFTSYYTSSLKEGHLGSLPLGVHAFYRAAFDIRGMIQLAGSQPTDHPNAVIGMAIDYKGEKLDFLLGAVGQAQEGTVIGSYLLHYADGETKKIPLVYGRNVKNFSSANSEPVLTDAVTAWSDKDAQVFKYTANNPLPGVEIKTMDFVSNNTQAAPFLIAMTIEPDQAHRTYEWLDSIKAWNPIQPRDPSATPDQVDLSKFYGTSLNDDWFDHPGHDLQDLPEGLQSFGGVLFDVRGLIVLAGTKSLEVSGLALPEAVMGIPVGRKGKAMDFLQAAAFIGGTPGLKIGEYVLHYENGETKTAELIYGENELDWWAHPADEKVTKAEQVWVGSNPATRMRDMKTQLIKFTWKNPLPEERITSIDFVSSLTASSPMLVAITVEP